jgi:cobalt/nickel transport system permease protein
VAILERRTIRRSMIPDWMREADTGPCQCSAVYHGKLGFVGKTVDGIFDFLEDAFVSESNSRRSGLLQSLDPRAKLISILAVIFSTSLIGDLRVLTFIYRNGSEDEWNSRCKIAIILQGQQL